MLQIYSIFRQARTIQRRLQQIRASSHLDKYIFVKNPVDEQKRYEDLYDEVGEIFETNYYNDKLYL